MSKLLNFDIKSKGDISKEFLKRNILTFHQATEYIRELRYGRNLNKDDLTTIFKDNKGTCSTKHAVLKQLAAENGFDSIKLILGIFKMSAENTPKIRKTLAKKTLKYIPEAHNYLKYENVLFDFTNPNSSPTNFAHDLLFEIEIQSIEINQRKNQIHQQFLINWLHANNDIGYSFNELWEIREQCIQDLSE